MQNPFESAVCSAPAFVKGPERRRAPVANERPDRRGECCEALDAPPIKHAFRRGVGELASPAPLPRGERESARGTPRLGASGALGTMAGSVDADRDRKGRQQSTRRYLAAIQDMVARILPSDRVAGCGRRPNGSAVSIQLHEGRASAVGLQTCAAVWLCPCCGRVISGRRRKELNHLLAWARGQGWQVVMMTRTVRHHRAMALDWLLAASRAASKRFYQSKDWRAIKPRIAGHVTATECPCGPNGFHPHTHTILLVKAPDEASAVDLLTGLRTAWEVALRKEGLDCNDHGFDVRGHAGAGDYISKWGVAEELTFGQAKGEADPRKGRSPWQLLAIAAGLHRDSTFSPVVAKLRWQEFAKAIKGRRQLVWSRGLKARAGIADMADEHVVAEAEQMGVEAEIGRLSAQDWRAIVRSGLRVWLLEQVEADGRAGFELVVARALRMGPAQGARPRGAAPPERVA